MLALLVRGHRRGIPVERFQAMGKDSQPLLRLCVLLRISILLYHIRGSQEVPELEFDAGSSWLHIRFPDGWLDNNPLIAADFEKEAQWLQRIKLQLKVS